MDYLGWLKVDVFVGLVSVAGRLQLFFRQPTCYRSCRGIALGSDLDDLDGTKSQWLFLVPLKGGR